MPVSIWISHGSPTPVYRQIVDQVCAAIASGDLREDEALPSIRSLAQELVLNPRTVSIAYDHLQRDGLVESRGTRGVFVQARRRVYTEAERRRRVEPSRKAFITDALLAGYTLEEIVEQVKEEVEALSPRRTKRRGT